MTLIGNITPISTQSPGRPIVNKNTIRVDQSLTKLKQATTDFEAIFIGEILKEMHSDASKGGLFGSSFEMGTYREMYDEAIAQQLAKSGILGIGKMLYRELAPAVKEESR